MNIMENLLLFNLTEQNLWCGTSPAAQTDREREIEEGTESAVGSVEIEQQPKNNSSTLLYSGSDRGDRSWLEII